MGRKLSLQTTIQFKITVFMNKLFRSRFKIKGRFVTLQIVELSELENYCFYKELGLVLFSVHVLYWVRLENV